MRTASQSLLDLVLQANACTDYRAAKLLNVSAASVSAWRRGKGHMSSSNVQKACELAGIPEETWYWHIIVSAEREKGPDGDIYREAAEDMARVARGERPSKKGVMQLAVRAFRKYVTIAGAVPTALMVTALAFASPNRVLASPAEPSDGASVYYGKSRKRQKAA